MALDPKKLKAGDVVTFGGNVELTVDEVSLNHVEWKDVIRATYFEEPFWKIAELKQPKLPELNHYELTDEGNYTEHRSYCDIYTPSLILKWLKDDVSALESAGVKESLK